MSTGPARAAAQSRYRAIWVATLLSNFGVWISVGGGGMADDRNRATSISSPGSRRRRRCRAVFTLVGGVLADRIDQRLIFLVAQVIVLVVALLLSVIDGRNDDAVAAARLTFAPTRLGAALPGYQTTNRRHPAAAAAGHALVLASVGWNIARAAGRGIGGLIIAVFGVPAAFAVKRAVHVLIIVVLVRQRRQSAIRQR